MPVQHYLCWTGVWECLSRKRHIGRILSLLCDSQYLSTNMHSNSWNQRVWVIQLRNPEPLVYHLGRKQDRTDVRYPAPSAVTAVHGHTGLLMWVLGILALNVCAEALYQLGYILSSQQLSFYKGDYKTTNEQLAIFYLRYLLLCASLSLKNRVYMIHIPVSSTLFFEAIFGCPAILPQLGLPLTRSQRVLQQHGDETGETAGNQTLLAQLASSWSLLLHFPGKKQTMPLSYTYRIYNLTEINVRQQKMSMFRDHWYFGIPV